MIRRVKKPMLLAALLLIGLASRAQGTIGGSDVGLTGGLNALRVAVPFLTIAPDSRAGAMGDVGAASTPDINSQRWNPAKYAFMPNHRGVALSYTPWLRALINDINLTYLAGYQRLDENQVISASLLYFSMGEITFTGPNDATPIAQHNPNEFAIDVGYAMRLHEHVSMGLAFRYIHSNLTGGFAHHGTGEAKAGSSVAGDISAYFQRPITIDRRESEMALGVNISNIGSKITYNDYRTRDFIPINLRVGGRLTMQLDAHNSLSAMLDLNKLLVPTPPVYNLTGDTIILGRDPNVGITTGMFQSFFDAPGGWREELNEISYSFGLEYWYSDQFAIRGGYFTEHPTKGGRQYFTVGAALRYNVLQLDFAYLIPSAGMNNPLANTIRFTLSFDMEHPSQRGRTRHRTR